MGPFINYDTGYLLKTYITTHIYRMNSNLLELKPNKKKISQAWLVYFQVQKFSSSSTHLLNNTPIRCQNACWGIFALRSGVQRCHAKMQLITLVNVFKINHDFFFFFFWLKGRQRPPRKKVSTRSPRIKFNIYSTFPPMIVWCR